MQKAKKRAPQGAGARRRQSEGLAPPKDHWKRKYYIPGDNIIRAARDLIRQSTAPQIDDFAGRMFALQDLVDNEELDKIEIIERESKEPAFMEIVKAVKYEAENGDDPEYARSIAGEFIDQAFRMDSATLPVWFAYQNRIRKRRIDSGYGLIDPPDERTGGTKADSVPNNDRDASDGLSRVEERLEPCATELESRESGSDGVSVTVVLNLRQAEILIRDRR